MSDLGFVAESVTTALTGLLVSDAYTTVRPRLSTVLRRSGRSEDFRIEHLDRLRGADPAALRGAVHEFVQRLAASDERLLGELRDAVGAPAPTIHQDIHHNRFQGPTQVGGGIQIINMREVEPEHEPEL
ncbi:hypothetical protein AB0O76_17825 [Streptomyces sp. NPDC086554]|uniref:hypothetical protein n=1 Tax=Streptomyces sp. NPDC086554 TaxID=3154864 RepID=UPI0034401063